MNIPIRPPSSPSDPAAGSMGVGFALGFAVMVGSTLASILLMTFSSMLHPRLSELFALPALLLPPGATIALVVWAYATGRNRTGAGVLAAIGATIALSILLVAACFGLVATMH